MPLRKSRSRRKLTKKSCSKCLRRSKSMRRKPRHKSRSKRQVLRRSKSRRKSLRKKSKRKNVRKSRSRRKPLRRSKSRHKPLRRSKSRRRSKLKYNVRSPRRGFKPIVSIGGAYLEPILSCIPRFISRSALNSSLLAKGGEGFVYKHPTDPDKVLKVSYFEKPISLLDSNEPPKNSSIQTANMLIERYKLYGGYFINIK